jgi:predicted transcriptional regulator
MSTKTIRDKVVGIRIPKEWHSKLIEIAEDECRTLNSVVNQAINEFLKKRKHIKRGEA